ncbi:MAG: hypothetical protein K9I94_12095 [Bacteroidales bacterium]|nr:hypothetical protein [Bacteroidales bacterium]
MKARLIIITSIVLSVFLITGCGGKKTVEDLEQEAKNLETLAERSQNIDNADEAFKLLRDLNQTMKDVRGIILAMDATYRDASDSKKQEMTGEFEKVNNQIDKSLNTISENVEPFEDEEEVQKMLKKLEDLLISR